MHLPLKIDYSNVYEYRYIKIYCLSYHHNEHITQLVLFHGWIRLTKKWTHGRCLAYPCYADENYL